MPDVLIRIGHATIACLYSRGLNVLSSTDLVPNINWTSYYSPGNSFNALCKLIIKSYNNEKYIIIVELIWQI